MFIKEEVNKINSPTWVRVNEDARKVLHRKAFIQKFGGEFVEYRRSGKNMLKWQLTEDYSDKSDQYIIQTPENTIEIVEVFSKFCRENELNKAAMYGTLRGDRNHHKGYKLIKKPE